MREESLKQALLICLLLVAVSTVGCYRHTYVVSRAAQAQPADSNHFAHHFLYGLVPASSDVELSSLCPNGVGKIETQTSFLNGFLNWLTNGIYTPRSTKVYCIDD